MKTRTYIRWCLVAVIVTISVVVLAKSRMHVADSGGNPDCNGKCEQQKVQTEFIFWESLSRNILSAGR